MKRTERLLLAPAAALGMALGAVPAAAAPVVYELDPLHTFPSIEFPHMDISVWRGKFDRTSGTVTLDREARSGRVEVRIDTASINFGLDIMDEKARGEEWFDVAQYPEATYVGELRFEGDKAVAVDGEFTFRGKTLPLTLTLNSFKCIEHPFYKKEVCGADALGELNWGVYGMKYSEFGQGDAGRVTLRIQAEAMPKSD
ncbi:MAG: YceI family protein [Sinimarinibacterium flocculans]|jgi:polyisoprenoid-binding protein YceI|uniref:Polyisoprenoid-binding protein YceI n=1 Tax=Sinimarinibacterium flocculans TaxID=985250 RepID=A0A318EEI0_9GAMM|nr:YceI family protein [Sinimarinibacterium flocculans]PXV71213.1 polyisoprenoid-binding protein YceI [Sinimarinibacterium flocculans]